MTQVPNAVEILRQQTRDRQTDDRRQTDGR